MVTIFSLQLQKPLQIQGLFIPQIHFNLNFQSFLHRLEKNAFASVNSTKYSCCCCCCRWANGKWSHHLTANKKREQEDVKKLEIKCLNHLMRLSQSSPRQMLKFISSARQFLQITALPVDISTEFDIYILWCFSAINLLWRAVQQQSVCYTQTKLVICNLIKSQFEQNRAIYTVSKWTNKKTVKIKFSLKYANAKEFLVRNYFPR